MCIVTISKMHHLHHVHSNLILVLCHVKKSNVKRQKTKAIRVSNVKLLPPCFVGVSEVRGILLGSCYKGILLLAVSIRGPLNPKP